MSCYQADRSGVWVCVYVGVLLTIGLMQLEQQMTFGRRAVACNA